MAQLEPGKEEVKALFKMPKNRPVIMLNLLKFRKKTVDGESGRKVYLRYMKNVNPLLEKVGGRLLWAGKAGVTLVGKKEGWDQVLLVEYPSPKHFLKMASSQEYRNIHTDREKALEKTELIATNQYFMIPDKKSDKISDK